MAGDMLVLIALLFIIVFVFDVSFNLRRIGRNFERLLRKLAEIEDLLQKKI
ncbi:MAG: hypothetical protein ABIG31_04215 [Candidatus Omnitrophota bacterium]